MAIHAPSLFGSFPLSVLYRHAPVGRGFSRDIHESATRALALKEATMSRIIRRVHQPGVYFVTTQTWQRRELFRKAALAEIVVNQLLDCRDRGFYQLHQFVHVRSPAHFANAWLRSLAEAGPADDQGRLLAQDWHSTLYPLASLAAPLP